MREDVDDNDKPFTMEELINAIKKIKKGTSPGEDGIYPEIISNAGIGLLQPLLVVFNKIRVTKEIPKQWNNVIITMIFKNKGSHLDLTKYRGIFLTAIILKTFERLIYARMKTSMDNVSLYQAGSRPGRSVTDNLFLLRGCIDQSNYLKKTIIYHCLRLRTSI